jgi:putative heme-binding domain-containing protein
MRPVLIVLSLLVFASWGYSQHIAPTEAKSPAEEKATFKLPVGFEVQLVAAEPQIGKPIQIAFDHKGRLWVTTSRHYPFAAAPGEKPSDKLYVLSDFGPDGLAKKVTTFADNLNIPIGILPLPDGNSCLVSHVGNILKLSDTDGDGKADKEEVLLTGFGSRDTHGMMNSFVLLPDGWVYACHGFSNESVVKGKDGSQIRMQSGNTFRFRPDGTQVEHWTKGQVNPFGMTVDPYMNLYTADCHSKPITQLIRGAHYDSFGKPHDGLGYGPHVTRHDHGSTALCGLAWYEANHFPKEWNGCLFLGNVVTNRINADLVEWVGGTPVAKELPDFLVSSDPWFRPTDIKLGPDGALYFADFYNRIIGHYEVDLKHPLRDKDRGRVWRIVWKGTDGKAESPKMPKDDLTQIKMDAAVARLADDNIVVRLQAANDVARRLKVSPNLNPQFPDKLEIGRVSTAIGLYCIAGETANSSIFSIPQFEELVKSLKEQIVQSPTSFSGMTVRSVSTRASWGGEERRAMQYVLKELHQAPHILRAALDGIVAHPHAEFVPSLLSLYEQLQPNDDHTRHIVRIAIRNSLNEPDGWGNTKALTEAQKRFIADIALGCQTAEAVEYLVASQKVLGLDKRYCEHVGRYGNESQAGELIKLCESNSAKLSGSLESLSGLSRGMQSRNASIAQDSKALVVKLCEEGLKAAEPLGIQAALELATTQKLQELKQQIQQFMSRVDRSEQQRLSALNALFALNTTEAIQLTGQLLTDSKLSQPSRERLAQLLGNIPQAEARTVLLATLATAPAKLAGTIGLALANSPSGADALLENIQQGKSSPRLLQDKAILAKVLSHDSGKRKTRVEALTKGLPSADAQIEATIRQRLGGFTKAKPDLVSGKQLFTTKCAICHQLAGEGAKVGPNLDGIGIRGPERLLEDILDPNRNIDATFRATVLNLIDGRIFTGQLVREEGEILILVDATGKEQRISKKDVEKKTVSTLSVMPANMHELPEVELFNILGFLMQLAKK